MNDIFCAPSHTRIADSTALRVAPSVSDESSIQRAQSPNPIENTMIGRNCPLASAANGFWKSPTRNVPNEPEPPAVDILETASMFEPAAWEAFAIDGFIRYASATPNAVAKTDVAKYQTRTIPPTFPDFLSGSEAAPIMSEKRMIGYTTIFSIATSTLPNGATHGSTFAVVSGAQNSENARPIAVPSTKPMRIFPISGIFIVSPIVS